MLVGLVDGGWYEAGGGGSYSATSLQLAGTRRESVIER